MTDEIFISYARTDRERAKILGEALEMHRCSVWWDRKIPVGRMFDEFIKEKLMEAKCVIVLWSRDSVKSRWVKDEAGRSEDKLIPVLIDDTDIPLGFGMLQTARLIDWKGDLADPTLNSCWNLFQDFLDIL